MKDFPGKEQYDQAIAILRKAGFKGHHATRAYKAGAKWMGNVNHLLQAAQHAANGRTLTDEERAEYDELSEAYEFGTMTDDHPIYGTVNGQHGVCIREAGPDYLAAHARLVELHIIDAAGLMLEAQ